MWLAIGKYLTTLKNRQNSNYTCILYYRKFVSHLFWVTLYWKKSADSLKIGKKDRFGNLRRYYYLRITLHFNCIIEKRKKSSSEILIVYTKSSLRASGHKKKYRFSSKMHLLSYFEVEFFSVIASLSFQGLNFNESFWHFDPTWDEQ